MVELATELGLRPVYVMGHLHALWHSVLEQQEDGDLSSWSDETIASLASYQGDAVKFVAALQRRGWLDGKLLHDWLDYGGKYLERKYRSSNLQLLKTIWKAHGRSYDKAGAPQMNPGWFRLRREILERDGFVCKTCGRRKNLQVDHIIPRSKGGKDVPENLVTSCRHCNISKER